MAVYKRGKVWWYKFTWNGELIRESTKHTNKRVAEQMEAGHKTSLAKGEVGIRKKVPSPTLRHFAENDFLPFVRSTFSAKANTLRYYENGVKNFIAYEKLAAEPLDGITTERIAGYAAKRAEAGLAISSVNRELQVLRRMFFMAVEWGKVEKALPRVRMLPGEQHRERVLTAEEEARYLSAAEPLLHDVAIILIDCGLRPEECFRLAWDQVRDGVIEIQYGKTDNARRRIPLSQRASAVVAMRRSICGTGFVFPAPTKSGHAEPSSVKKQHLKACGNRAATTGSTQEWSVKPFPLYTLRHTCLTRWAPHMDPWTLAYLAGHRDMAITKRYVHPQTDNIREALARVQEAKGRHNSGHNADLTAPPNKP
ncbi:MAG TPA: tyrosine-type recombinase/integrase [Bryobacteraceae bacterium]|nr:tyrosine-type recombinase/integrase [Bryobacteraceae bacterium]